MLFLNNKSIGEAVDFAAEITSEAVAITIKETGFQESSQRGFPVIASLSSAVFESPSGVQTGRCSACGVSFWGA